MRGTLSQESEVLKMEDDSFIMRNWVEVRINAVDDFDQWIDRVFLSEEQRAPYNRTEHGGYDSGQKWVFRGQADADWGIRSSLERLVFDCCFDAECRRAAERQLIEEFQHRLRSILSGRKIPPFDLVALMQHYGMPTRLVDFAYSAFVALYFAADEGAQYADKDFAIWSVNLNDLHTDMQNVRIFDPYNACKHEDGTHDNLAEELFDEESFGSPRSILYYRRPCSDNERSNAQSGAFMFQLSLGQGFMDDLKSCAGQGPDQMELEELLKENPFCTECTLYPSRLVTFRFDKSLRDRAIVKLRSMNMNRNTMFPDFDGDAETISRTVNEILVDLNLKR